MKTRFRWLLAVSAGMLIALTGTARAQEMSLNMVPAKAPIVVQLNGLENARNRLGKLLGNALPDLAPKLAKQMDDGLKQLAEGRDLKSISKNGRIYFVISDLNNLFENPQAAILVPVSGYGDFKESFLKEDERKSLKKDDDGFDSVKVEGKEEPYFIVDRKNYVVLTADKNLAKSYAKGDEAGLNKAVSKSTVEAFVGQDISIYVNLKEINKQYGAQIRGLKSLLDLGLMGGGMGIDKKQIEMIKQVFNGFLQIMEDGVAVVFGFDFRPEGANIRFMVQFGADSETNSFLKKLKPAALKEIGSLPGGLLTYSASNFDMNLSKTLSTIMKTALADDENEDAKKIIQDALKELSDNNRAFELTGANIITGGLQVAEYKDSAKAVASELKMYKAMSKTSTMGGLPLKDKPVIKENAETVGELKLHSVNLSFDFDKAVQEVPEQVKEATRAMLMKTAGEKSTLWFGSTNNKVIQVHAKDWTEAKDLLSKFLENKDPLDKDESFQITRKQLPVEATIVVMADSARFIQAMLDMVKEMFEMMPIPGLPGGALPMLKAPKGKPAYFGIAIVLKDEYASFDFFVPVTAVQQVRKMFAPLIDMDN